MMNYLKQIEDKRKMELELKAQNGENSNGTGGEA